MKNAIKDAAKRVFREWGLNKTTNNLIGYAVAIDRINDQVMYLYEPLHPAALRLIKYVVDAGHKAGIKIAVCGEMAGESLDAKILLGFWRDELSMNPLTIPRGKKIVRESNLLESQKLQKKALMFSSGTEAITNLCRRFHAEAFS